MATPNPGPNVPKTEVSLKHVLLSEILSVTSVMRKNSRWASSLHTFSTRDSALASSLGLRRNRQNSSHFAPERGSTEQDLMGGFQELRRLVKEVDDISSLPLTTLLAPFFAIIRSPLSTGPITSAALSSLHNFFICNLISPGSLGLGQALSELSSTVSRCKFEASDSSGDEVVLLKIITLVQDCMCGNVSDILGDIEVCEMLETTLTTCCQMRLSELLRRSAEATMHALVRTVFARLHQLDSVIEEQKLKETADETQENDVKMNVQTDASSSQTVTADAHPPSGDNVPEDGAPQDVPIEESADETASTPISPGRLPKVQYGLPSILELLRVLINILDPSDQAHTDSTRLTALRVLNVAFEVAGMRICDFPSLSALVLDYGCKYLFQLARSDNPVVLQTTLRTISTMFETMRPKLKMQLELFLTFTIDRLAPPSTGKPPLRGASPSPRPGTPSLHAPHLAADLDKPPPTPRPLVPPARGDIRELLLETLSLLSDPPSFMVDLYANYDCDINCDNMFERLLDFATKGIYSSNYGPHQFSQAQNAQYICLDLVLAFVNHMSARAEGVNEPWPSEFTPPHELLKSKSQKQLILTGAARFNTKPKGGVTFLEEKQLIYTEPDVPRPLSLARFLKSCTRLDKRLLGDYLSRPENLDLLQAFMGLFDFRDKTVADAMREFMEAFRLPGESQQINRITETFAEVYFAADPAEVKSQDAIYVLAYSIIMLNTDLHNPQIRKRMTIEDYKRNLKGVNDGSNFSDEYLQNIYDSIRKQEIVMPEEHTGQLGFEYAWKELLQRSKRAGDFTIANTSLFDAEMFKGVWKPVVSAIAYAFITFEDDYIIERAISGFRQCATLARHFNMPDVFDYVVVSLSQATSLLPESLPAQVPNYPVVEVEGQSVTISFLSTKFGTNFKGQLAAVVLFNIVNGNGNALREGWTQIFEMFENLFLHSLLPTEMLQMEDFLGGVTSIPLRKAQPPRPAQRSDGLLSALSSYLMTPYSASTEALVPEATDSDIENTLAAIDCITSCRLDGLYKQILQLDPEALGAAVRALEALAHERTVAKLRQEADDVGPTLEPSQDGSYALPYDPASVFLLEAMISITCKTPEYIQDLWPIIYEHISALLSTPTQYSILLIERAVVGLLRICLILSIQPSLRDQVYVSFDILANLPPSISNAVAEQIASGFILIATRHRHIISSPTEWRMAFSLLRSIIPHPEASRQTFEYIQSIIADGPDQCLTPDNLPGLVTVLDEFATVAGVITDAQQQGRRNQTLNAANTPPIERGLKAVDILFDLKRFWAPIAEKAKLQPEQVWHQYNLPLLSVLARQCSNTSREIRHTALVHIQRLILGPHISLDPEDQTQVEELFNRVIFPLLDELLKSPTFLRDPTGMPETRLRASALLAKAFMHLEARENQQADIRVIWIQVLDLMDRLMYIDRRDPMTEAIPESLKNVVLVMNATHLLVPPIPGSDTDTRESRQKALWAATHERMERFLPGFLADVLPPPPPPAAPAPAAVPVPVSAPTTAPQLESQPEPQPPTAEIPAS